MKKKSFLKLIVSLFVPVAFANEYFDFKPRLDLRYDTSKNEQKEVLKSRYQSRIRLGANINLSEGLSLVGLISTGDSYTSDWYTLKDLTEQDSRIESPELFMRRLYLEKKIDKIKFQFGGIPTVKDKVSITGLDTSGWVDGTRFEMKSVDEKTIYEVVVGSIDGLDNPDFFSRNKKVNYFEAEISRKLYKRLVGEIKFEKLSEKNYIQGTFEQNVKLVDDNIVTLAMEYLHNTDQRIGNYTASVDFDPLVFFDNKYKEYVTMVLAHIYSNEELGLRTELNDNFYTYGYINYIGMKGRISKNGAMRWFVNSFFSDETRFNTGVNLSF